MVFNLELAGMSQEISEKQYIKHALLSKDQLSNGQKNTTMKMALKGK